MRCTELRVDAPNRPQDANWGDSLTPHKICDAFSKEPGKAEARAWLEHYGPPAVDRLNGLVGGLEFELNDVIAMQMLCGYETVVRAGATDGARVRELTGTAPQISKDRKSAFCSNRLFEDDEFRAFGYWNDLHYHAFVGYGSKVAPYLGAQWLNVSTHNLLSAYAPPHKHPKPLPGLWAALSGLFRKKPKLPTPDLPPDATHTQLLFPYFTHREEPPVALVALGLWNTTSLPTDTMPKDRLWKTSHLLPFLGHIAIERLSCDALPERRRQKDEFVRVVVNGAPQPLPGCQSGPGGSCPKEEFAAYVDRRLAKFGDFEGACKR